MSKTLTRGNVIVEDIKIGDIHYEFDGRSCIKSKVAILPQMDEDGNWYWTSTNMKTLENIEYGIGFQCPAHYSLKLYDYEAYIGCRYI